MTISEYGLDQEYQIARDTQEQFWRDGWASLPELISPQLAGDILKRLDASDAMVKPTAAEKWMSNSDYQRVLRMHDGLAWSDDWFKALALSQRMTDLALKLIGQDEGLFIHDMSFIKTGADGEPTPFHQDFPHWPFDRTGAFTIWIALTDMSPDMGTLQFMSGSQREGPLGRYSHKAGDDMVNANPYLRDKYPLQGGNALRAGDATVHVDLMIHGANGNPTGKDRAAYTLRYMPKDVIYTGATHRHFDKFGLKSGERFTESAMVPHIGRSAA